MNASDMIAVLDMTAVLDRRAPWACVESDAIAFLASLPDDSIDLLFTSPPYRKARTYGIGAGRDTEEWTAWMVEFVRAAAPKVKGLIAINCEGQTEDYQYHPTPYLLLADLHRAGFNTRRPAFFHRIGIPGSGGPDWLRADVEPIICITRPGKLPWSDNTACGHPPKWAPGGEMSHRLTDGTRVTQWGHRVKKDGTLAATDCNRDGTQTQTKNKPSHRIVTVGESQPDVTPELFDAGESVEKPKPKTMGQLMKARGGNRRRADGKREKMGQDVKPATKKMHARNPNGERDQDEHYAPPVLANPGNVIQQTYTADEVAALLGQASEVTHCVVGGGAMGHALAHENEAPFPLELPTFFVLSFCPPDGVVCDPFSGSGTTAHAAMNHGRRFVGCDLRKSQVDLATRRLRGVTPTLFAGVE